MVDISDYIDDGSDEEADDLVALKACLQALADAVASTNLAVIAGAHGDTAQAAARVQASVAALKRFSEAFGVLDAPEGQDEPEEAADD